MASRLAPFNAYLILVAVACCGCQSPEKKEASTLRLHLEVSETGGVKSSRVPIYRQNPVFVNVESAPFATEAHIAKASVVDAIGSFQVMLQYDRRGTWLLEQYSVAHRGRRIAIYSQFGDARWLAAPVMSKRITDGVLVFTPDASREEADRIVRGLNNVARTMQKNNP